MYSEPEVLQMIKGIIRELAGVLVKAQISPPSPFHSLNNHNIMNFNSLLTLSVLSQNQMNQRISQNMNEIFSNVLEQHKSISNISRILVAGNDLQSQLGLNMPNIFDLNKNDTKKSVLSTHLSQSIHDLTHQNFKFEKREVKQYEGLVKLNQRLNLETKEDSDIEYQSTFSKTNM